MWEHAPAMQMPLSEDALAFARKLAAANYTYPDDRPGDRRLVGAMESGVGKQRRLNVGWRCGYRGRRCW